jgi:hypothetical protein
MIMRLSELVFHDSFSSFFLVRSAQERLLFVLLALLLLAASAADGTGISGLVNL